VIKAELHVNTGISNTGKWRLDWTGVFDIVLTMSSANASSIETLDNPEGKAVLLLIMNICSRIVH